MRSLNIDTTQIDDASPCYVIAEIGNNHQGSLETCKEMFKVAKECGAQAVKLQKRDNRYLYTRAMYDQIYNSENAYGPTYGLHRDALELGRDAYIELKRYANELGITFFSTAFDLKSADLLEELDMPAYKIASGDLRSIPLLRHIARFKKPMVVSTGGASMEDVVRAYDSIMPINQQLCILQCTAAYPAKFEDLDLKVITTFRERFPDIVIGLSSHDNGISIPIAAYMLGARMIEKHFTLNRAWKGTDHAFSLEPVGMRKMCRDLQRVHSALGDGRKKIYETEKAPVIKMGKKLVVCNALKSGHRLTEADIMMKSPGDGVPPFELEMFLGKTLIRDMHEDQALSYDLIK